MVLPDGVVLQGFHWESSTPDCRDPSQWPEGRVTSSWYSTVEAKVEDIRKAGFSDVWLPPPSESVAKEGYLPTKLYNLNSAYGNASQLRSLLQTLHGEGVGAILDVVVNHRCGDQQDEEGRWVLYSDELGHDNRRVDWGPWALVSNHPDPNLAGTGNPKDEYVYHAAPNVDHSNQEVRDSIKSWLNFMTRPRNLGYSSLRFDFVLGYGAKYVKEYVDSTVYPRGELCIGEYWDGNDGKDPAYTNTEMLLNWAEKVDGHCGVFDFALKAVLHKAALTEDWSLLGSASDGHPGLMGARPELAFTFVDNHDTACPQAHFPFPENSSKLLAVYAYLLSHPGIPVIFWLHLYGKKNASGLTNGKEPDVSLTEADGRMDLRNTWAPPTNPGFSWEESHPGHEPWSVESQDGVQGPIYTGICGEEIKKMVQARRDSGVHSTSKVRVVSSSKDLYHAVVTGRTVYGSSRSGGSEASDTLVREIVVMIGPKAREQAAGPGLELISSGALHAFYTCVTPTVPGHGVENLDEAHPHTIKVN